MHSWLITTLISSFLICAKIYPTVNEPLPTSSCTSNLHQEEFDSMLLHGIVDSLQNLNLSKEELSELEDRFIFHVEKIYGSMKLAEQTFENDPKVFEDKYLELFCLINKEIYSNRAE